MPLSQIRTCIAISLHRWITSDFLFWNLVKFLSLQISNKNISNTKLVIEPQFIFPFIHLTRLVKLLMPISNSLVKIQPHTQSSPCLSCDLALKSIGDWKFLITTRPILSCIVAPFSYLSLLLCIFAVMWLVRVVSLVSEKHWSELWHLVLRLKA